jgi:hypothetical protein
LTVLHSDLTVAGFGEDVKIIVPARTWAKQYSKALATPIPL